MNQVTELRRRGIQEADVFAAADALLAEGKRPTIERVRLKVGRGSPNTVSPMLEKWFATLGERLGVSPAAAGHAAENDPDGMPLGVRNAARLLWETARREAEEVQRGELEADHAQLREREESLSEAQEALARREEAFAQARVSLDAALASSQQAREALELQLKEHAIEAHRVRAGLDDEIKRLNALLSHASESQERQRQDHAEALAAKDRDLRQAEERHAGQERRMLAEVDQARLASRRFEAGLAKEQQRRIQSEEAAAQTLEAGRRMLREAQQAAQAVERELRDRLTEQTGLSAASESQKSALQQRLGDLEAQNVKERKSHESARATLAEALAALRAFEKPNKTTTRKSKRTSD